MTRTDWHIAPIDDTYPTEPCLWVGAEDHWKAWPYAWIVQDGRLYTGSSLWPGTSTEFGAGMAALHSAWVAANKEARS